MRGDCNIKKVRITLIGKEGKMGRAISSLAKQDPEVEVGEEGEIVVDFSSPEGTKKALALQKPLVCGTTGLSHEVMEELRTLSKKVPVLYSPNFSLGMTLCFEILDLLKKKRTFFSKIAIEETHHKDKVDAPSGTAKRMAQLLGVDKVSSHRIDEVIGTHEINFFLEEEKIILKHEALSRKVFAKGALAAVKFIYNRPPKFYTLHDLFV